MSSIWGNKVKISLFGESHGVGIGAVIDGLPAGYAIDLERANRHMKRRSPGYQPGATARREEDRVRILSGLYMDKTTGTPLCALIENHDTKSADYSKISAKPRPGHADLTGLARYEGSNDPRGGGHFSGRLTAPLTFAGALALQILESRGVIVRAHIYSIGTIEDTPYDPMKIPKDCSEHSIPVISEGQGLKMRELIETLRNELDSVGGVIECIVTGFPAGLGRPIFDNIESRLSSIIFGIPAVKGIEFGRGFGVSSQKGSTNNDEPYMTERGIRLRTNHAGGIEGGITNGMPILLRCAFKPTPSIGKQQNTVNLETMSDDTIEVGGRHDSCIVPRAVPVVESAVAFALLDIMEEG
ncbi:MAG: chorismate synthase [Clostridiaceae bacterium]|nr:chorismate synthase [Clostridiaceae bacterium]